MPSQSLNRDTVKFSRKFQHYLYLLPLSVMGAYSHTAYAQADIEQTVITPADQNGCPTRPKILTNRWQEDWSVLKNDCVSKKTGDSLKYLPFGENSYLSLGANVRERFELNDNVRFGTSNTLGDRYLIQRLQAHADVRIGDHLQFFTQLVDARAFNKKSIAGVDKDQLDVEQAFFAWVSPYKKGTFKFRVGRQEMAFDTQRFISNREGPNVRQAFDGVWANYEYQQWRVLGYLTQPVQIETDQTFNDRSNQDLVFNGVRVDRLDVLNGEMSGYYSRYKRSHAAFPSASGTEVRDLYDLRYMGKKNKYDWDVEGMFQSGNIGNQSIRAWALSSISGYTFDTDWSPRIGLQLDAASGDKNRNDHHLNTFNQLFANGSYFTLAGYSGYSNILHVKPSITVKPTENLTVMGALGFQWRMTKQDAIYAQGNSSIANTAGKGDLWTGNYYQLRFDQKVNANVSLALEAVRFQVGDTIKQAGGKNSNYLGLEFKYGW